MPQRLRPRFTSRPPDGATGGGASASQTSVAGRNEAIRRLQMGVIGVVAVLVLIALASVIKDRAVLTETTAVAGAAATSIPTIPSAGNDPLAEAGMVPEIPGSSPIVTPTPAPPPATDTGPSER